MSTSKGFNYLDEDGTKLEAMGPTRETLEENKFKGNLQLCYMTKFLNLRMQSLEAFKISGDRANIYPVVV